METCAKFQQKILNSVAVAARQSLKFSDKQPGFSEIKELRLNEVLNFESFNWYYQITK